jgi:hypothetical protein
MIVICARRDRIGTARKPFIKNQFTLAKFHPK